MNDAMANLEQLHSLATDLGHADWFDPDDRDFYRAAHDAMPELLRLARLGLEHERERQTERAKHKETTP